MKKRLLIKSSLVTIFLLLCSASVLAISFECNTDGSLSIRGSTKKAELWTKMVEGDDPYFPVKGEWKRYEESIGPIKVKRYKFESDEGIFVQGEKTKYYLKLGKKRYTITCPPFVFACKRLNTTIESCYMRNNTFYSKFFVQNIPLINKKVLRFGSPYSLEYSVKLEDDSRYSRSPLKYHPVFKDIIITQKKLKEGNKYKLMWQRNDTTYGVKEFSMFYKCEKTNFFRDAECKDMPACRYSGDCFKKEYCENGFCQELDCDECEFIENYKCRKYECCESDMCTAEQECINHSCAPLNCTDAEVIEKHKCVSLECKDDEYTFNHTCAKLDCEKHEYPVNHTCELLRCKENEYIENHECKKLDCKWYERPLAHDCVSYFSYILAQREDEMNKKENKMEG